MPSMYEIYDRFAREYDELVVCEDYEGNLRRALHGLAEWRDAVVIESGIGTGRVTRSYVSEASKVIGIDRSAHMLEQAARNLAPWNGKIRLLSGSHRALPLPDGVADIFVEGWAFGHVAMDEPQAVSDVAAALVTEAARVTKPGGTVLLIETLGTNVDGPGAPHPVLEALYTELEKRHGFARTVISTSYKFASLNEARTLMGFFFGEEMGTAVAHRLERAEKKTADGTSDGLIIPEYTGIWSRAARPSGPRA